MAEAIKRANIRAYIGATGSGKGISILQHLKETKPARLLIFDPMHEYGHIARPVATVAEALRAMRSRAFKVAWQPGDETDFESKDFKASFQLFCRAAFTVGDLTLLVEELELVTRASWAPPAWRMCTKRGRHQGLSIIAASQRPADCDKAFLSGCTFVRVFALREHEDRARMARALDVDQEQIDRLQTLSEGNRTRITYFERDFSAGTQQEKTVTLTR